jgi:uncharacterized protein YkwD
MNLLRFAIAVCAGVPYHGSLFPFHGGKFMTSSFILCAGMMLLADPQAPAPAKQAAAPAAKATATTPAKVTGEDQPKRKVKAQTVAFFPVEVAIVNETNAQRAKYGLPPLELDPNLLQTARQHAWWMTRNRTMQHGNYPVAENIAMGQRSSTEVVNCWMNSSGHRANILNRGHRRIGVAAYTTPSGTTYWCQQFSP